MAIRLRIIIAILGSYACSLVYMHRSGISVAVVAMTKNPVVDQNQNISSLSSSFNYTSSSVSDKPLYDWSETLQVN